MDGWGVEELFNYRLINIYLRLFNNKIVSWKYLHVNLDYYILDYIYMEYSVFRKHKCCINWIYINLFIYLVNNLLLKKLY